MLLEDMVAAMPNMDHKWLAPFITDGNKLISCSVDYEMSHSCSSSVAQWHTVLVREHPCNGSSATSAALAWHTFPSSSLGVRGSGSALAERTGVVHWFGA